ncbi:MAG TPA: DUF4199 domain-containing protein [Caulobacteraceae bacterium]|nr:DUF4199 domain-containing protein [Caulobacteraceae bacterium]
MTRIILVFGLISGVMTILGILATFLLPNAHGSVWLGYLIMLVALSAILVGVRQHRDRELGGVIRFWPALGVGLGIALVATLAYVAIWEVYLAATHYTFMDSYVAAQLAAKRAAGVTGAAYQQFANQMEAMKVQYRNPIYRMLLTAMEIAPVGLIIAIASAALLRNPRFLPAKQRAAAA